MTFGPDLERTRDARQEESEAFLNWCEDHAMDSDSEEAMAEWDRFMEDDGPDPDDLRDAMLDRQWDDRERF